MPPRKAECGGEQRRFVIRQRADRVECRAGVGVGLNGLGEARKIILNAEEEIDRGRRLPFEPSIFANGGQAIPPEELEAAFPGGDLAKPGLVDPDLVRAIDSRP